MSSSPLSFFFWGQEIRAQMRGGQRKAEPVTQAAVLPSPTGTGGILPGLGHCTWWLRLAQPRLGAWHLSGGSAVPGDTARAQQGRAPSPARRLIQQRRRCEGFQAVDLLRPTTKHALLVAQAW